MNPKRLPALGDRLVNAARYEADLEEFRRNPPSDDGSLKWLLRMEAAASTFGRCDRSEPQLSLDLESETQLKEQP